MVYVDKISTVIIGVIILCNLRGLMCFSPAALCSRIPGLSPKQKKLCSESPDAVVALGNGHSLGSRECQYQFKGHRWNCSEVWQKDIFGHVISVGSREAAFTYAIANAGIVYAIAAACSRGNISICGCDQVHRHKTVYQDQSWKWGGCSVDIEFGIRFARKFLDVREIEGDARSEMNLHNNQAGRKIVRKLLKKDCQCHGISGSCQLKTCWKTLPQFREVGDVLLRKYEKAKLVEAQKKDTGINLVIKRRGRGDKEPLKPKNLDLVYLQQSPNYCEKNILLGSSGTHGRKCTRTSSGVDSCKLLCCGRGYATKLFHNSWQCNCKFEWALMNVKCEICSERTEEYFCK
ncbi:CLUMA_CG004539, isoform A [Clunio marinus]|uniref:Protein Wnt n=1 Tax=Clunio marinus TaxID=568069 RepID=A0A1J1HXI2_9DIPT|nr:CLUMA_CG004539, isoform A [Clunio marinus]